MPAAGRAPVPRCGHFRDQAGSQAAGIGQTTAAEPTRARPRACVSITLDQRNLIDRKGIFANKPIGNGIITL